MQERGAALHPVAVGYRSWEGHLFWRGPVQLCPGHWVGLGNRAAEHWWQSRVRRLPLNSTAHVQLQTCDCKLLSLVRC